MAKPDIAILGWGSLIWDQRPEFDSQISSWATGGPVLPVEFCRISDSRKGALTLVIERKLGTEVETLYSLSQRSDPRDAVCDLRSREGTIVRKIGYVNLAAGEEQGGDLEVAQRIKGWATQKGFKFVVWTDLESNFREKKSAEFSFDAALNHLKNLSPEGIREAVKYILMTPQQVNTALRQWLATVDWFKEQVALFENEV